MSSKQHPILKFLQRSLWNRLCYFSDKLYSVSASGVEALPLKNGFRPLLILARQHYREELVWYPIVKIADVKKLVSLKLLSATSSVLVSFGPVINNQTPVTYFYPQADLDVDKAYFILPETLLLAANKPIGTVFSYQSLSGQKVFVARTPAATVSSLQGGVLQSIEQFAMAHGLNVDDQLQQIELQTTIAPTMHMLLKLPWAGLRNHSSSKQNGDNKQSIRYLTGALFVSTLYLVSSYQWSEYLLEKSRQELQQASTEANQLLTERETIQQLKQRYEQLAVYIPKHQDELLLWQILAPFYESNVSISSLEQKGNDIRIEIQASSATDALQLLLKQTRVVNAGFDSPVRRRNELEEVGIRFSLTLDKEA